MSKTLFSLEGKHILITGASSGIGKEAAVILAMSGARVMMCGRDENRLSLVLASLEGSGHQVFAGDLTSPDALNNLVEELEALDGVVHSAGITGHLPVKFIGKQDVSSFFSINYEVPVLLTAALLKKKKLKSPSSLIFLSSIATKYSYYGGALYSGTKSALEAYSRNLALELGPKGIRSNCISPSFVKTPMVEGAAETISNEVMQKFEKMMPLGFGEPADVAHAIVFLLSDEAKWITGTNLVLGGG